MASPTAGSAEAGQLPCSSGWRGSAASTSGTPRTDGPGFTTQPYEQLAAVYRQGGQDREARTIGIARRSDLRKYGNLTWYRMVGNWLLDKTIKYGYQTWRAAAGLAAIYVAVLVRSVIAQHHGLITPIGNIFGLHPATAAIVCTADYPCFYPVGYAIDTVIPIINVHQADYWGPAGQARGAGSGSRAPG